MSEYKCNICDQVFKTKQNLVKHQNKLFKCNFKTPYQCNKCLKYFRKSASLLKHTDNKICDRLDIIPINNNLLKNNTNINDAKIAIRSIICSTDLDEKKIELLTKLHVSLTNENILPIFNSNLDIDGKISFLYTILHNHDMKGVTNINNGTINTTNNIQINNFGQEKIDYLDQEYFKNLIMNQHIEKGYVQLIKDIYLNKDHPENGTVKVENINNKYAHVYNNGKWDTTLKSDLKELLHKKNYTILKMHYDKLKKSMSIPKKEETIAFLKRDETGDPHMMYVIDKIILLFYNGDENIDKINKSII
jgi:hypothetical protein